MGILWRSLMTRVSTNLYGYLLLLIPHCIYILHISNMLIYNSNEIHFGTAINSLL
jgi:hypothetical protein